MKRILLSALAALAIVSCSPKQDALIGKWKFIESGFIDMGKETVDSAKDVLFLTFTKDGKMSYSGDIQPVEIHYIFDSKTGDLKFAGETRHIKLSKDRKLLEISYEQYVEVVKSNVTLVERYEKIE